MPQLNFFPVLTIDHQAFQDRARHKKVSKLLPYFGAAYVLLEDFGEFGLSERMCRSMDAGDVRSFAFELRRLTERLEQRAKDNPEPLRSKWDFRDAIAEIQRAVDWYDRVGELDCGVHFSVDYVEPRD